MRARRMKNSRVGVLLVTVLLLAGLVMSGCSLLPTNGQTAGDSGSEAISPRLASSPPVDAGGAKDQALTQEYAASVAEPVAGSESAGPDASTVPAAERLVVRTVDMRLKVDEVEATADKVRKAAEKRKGMVIDYQVSTDAGVPIYRPYVEGSALADGAALSGYITVRVPADQLRSFVDELSGMGKVLRQAENEQDVTQEHVDLKARLVNLQATEARLREFFGKAKNVSEMLAIEQELTRVRGDIESMQAQIAYLERQAAMSTVTIELAGPEQIVEPAGEDWGFSSALRQAVRGFVGTINVLIILLGTLAPVIVIGAIAFFAIRALVRRRRANRPDAQSDRENEDAPQDDRTD